MAIKNPTVEYLVGGNPNICRATWVLANGDTGAPVQIPEFPDRTVQVYGTFGTGGSVTMEGSNDRVDESPTYATLTDPQGNAVTKTSAAIEVFEEVTLLVRPNCTAGDGTTSLTVRMVARRPR